VAKILTAENITKSYGQLEVLKGINLQVQAGEILSIIGKSGSGKSTLLHVLGTLQKPNGGTVKIQSEYPFKLSKKKLSKFRNRHIGFVFQFHNLLPEFSALENVMLPALIYKTTNEAKSRALNLLDLLGLGDRADHRPNQLSGGEQQRVAIARALINQPDIVFADEPTGNLDEETSGELHELILKLRKELNQTFVIVTHNTDLAHLGNRTLTMLDGLLETQNP
jgi:lipoprotein-releasing system ATP-binding protein